MLSANEAGCEFANIKPLLHRKPCMLCLWSEELFYSLTSLSMLHTVHDVFYTYIIQNRVYNSEKCISSIEIPERWKSITYTLKFILWLINPGSIWPSSILLAANKKDCSQIDLNYCDCSHRPKTPSDAKIIPHFQMWSDNSINQFISGNVSDCIISQSSYDP